MTDTSDQRIPVDPASGVGSERLAAALAAGDIPAVGQALRHDIVVVPLTRGPEGEPQTRVFSIDEPQAGQPPWALYVFSSVDSFATFIKDDENREFAIQPGLALASIIVGHAEHLGLVVFDAAGPHGMAAVPSDVLAALQPQPGDDEVAWVTDSAAERATDDLEPFPRDADPLQSRAVGFDIALAGDWAPIQLDDDEQREEQAREIVRSQLGRFLNPQLRGELERTIADAAARAAAAGGTFMAYSLNRNDRAALALSLVLYWRPLGPPIGDRPHLDRLEEQLRATPGSQGAVIRSETNAGPLVRHSRVNVADAESGGADVLLIDYWLEFPDRRGLALVSFSSTHAQLTDQLLLLCDNILLTGAWVMESDPI